MFGVIGDGFEAAVAGFKVRVEGVGEFRVYVREADGDVKSRVMVARALRLMLVPYPPFLLPLQDLVSCLYLRLESPVVVPAGSSVSFTVPIPYDYAVVASGGGGHTLVDIFPSEAGPPKMAVYGDLMEGLLCRYYRAEVNPEEPPRGSAASRVEVVNESGEQVSLSRIVAPRRGLEMIYNPSTGDVVASGVRVRVRGFNEAEVTYTPPPELEGYVAVPTVEREKRLLEVLSGRLHNRIVMTWGL